MWSNSAPNFKVMYQSMRELQEFQKVQQKEEEKYEEIKTNFEDAYFGNGSAEFETEGAPTPTEFVQKISCVSVQGVSSYSVFFTPVKYTLVCRAPWVSWAARHTTVCLDL